MPEPRVDVPERCGCTLTAPDATSSIALRKTAVGAGSHMAITHCWQLKSHGKRH
jgi:hypothetical protein